MKEAGRKIDKDEDLYNWMARQQRSGGLKVDLGNKVRERHVESSDQMPSNNSSTNMQQPNLLVDTRAIFGSLFASVGLENKKSLSEILSLSGRASVLGGIEELRVEIFESEWNQGTTTRRNKKTNGRQRSANSSKFSVHIPPEVPAFLCERMAIEIEVKQVSDARLCYPRAAGFLGQAFWKPQRTTALNFSLSVGYLAQQVNMPLLRLLHQLSSVYVNAKATQVHPNSEQSIIEVATDILKLILKIHSRFNSESSVHLKEEPILCERWPSSSTRRIQHLRLRCDPILHLPSCRIRYSLLLLARCDRPVWPSVCDPVLALTAVSTAWKTPCSSSTPTLLPPDWGNFNHQLLYSA